jgi:hypothetical protein
VLQRRGGLGERRSSRNLEASNLARQEQLGSECARALLEVQRRGTAENLSERKRVLAIHD